MLQVSAEEFELRSQGLPGQLDCMRVRATSLQMRCLCCNQVGVPDIKHQLTRRDLLR